MAGGPDIDPTTNAPHAVRTFWTVQAMRAVAALLVVVGHSQTIVAAALPAGTFARSTILPWGAGVDLFFIISGFVMVHASRGLFGVSGAGPAFLARRLVRVVPLYWLATALLLLLLGASTLKGGDPFPGVGAIVASLAFVPFDTQGNGTLMPVLDLGWTLNYEMFFYLLFAGAAALPRRRAIGAVLAALVALSFIGRWVPADTAPGFWTRPILIDFALGMAVGAIHAGGGRLPQLWRVALAAGAVLVFVTDPAGIFAVPAGVTVANDWPRVLGAGVPCAALLAAAVLGAEPRQPVVLRPLGAVGDASYSLYLLHPFVLIVIEKLMQKLPVVKALPPILLVSGAVCGAVALALVAFRWIERPITARLTTMLRPDRRDARRAAVRPA